MSDDGALLPCDDLRARSAITIPVTDTMMEAAELLRERLTERQYNALFESIVHITSVKLNDADYGIIDADPPDGSANTREVKS
jgi:hypothetical protein